MHSKLGQNFLRDTNILKRIVKAAGLSKEDTVIEIGTGEGVLTLPLAEQAGRVITYEIDEALFESTRDKYTGQYPNIDFIRKNVMKMDWQEEFKINSPPFKVVANIPYYITTPILERLVGVRDKISLIVLMMQSEVGDRIVAGTAEHKKGLNGHREYGSLSVFMQYHFAIEIVCNVDRSCFSPAPKVDSVVLKFLPYRNTAEHWGVQDEKFFLAMVRAAFWARRKTLRNCLLKSPFTNKYVQMIKANINLIPEFIRGEEMTLEEMVTLANAIGRCSE